MKVGHKGGGLEAWSFDSHACNVSQKGGDREVWSVTVKLLGVGQVEKKSGGGGEGGGGVNLFSCLFCPLAILMQSRQRHALKLFD